MSALQKILQQVVVKMYYRQNAGFFLVVFIFAFGLQSPPSLLISPEFLISAVNSPIFILVTLLLFFLYYLKCFNFTHKTFNAPQNTFLQVTALLPPKILFYNLIRVHILLYLPALFYSLLLVGYVVWQKNYLAGALILFYNSILASFFAIFFYKQIVSTKTSTQLNFFPKFGTIPAFNTIYFWLLRFLLRQEKVMLLLTKLFSGSILLSFLYLYPYPNYDLRPTLIGFWTAIVSHVMVVRQVQLFQESSLPFLRNLPYTRFRRFWHQAVLFAICLVPELTLLLRYLPLTTYLYIILLFTLGISLMLLMHALLYLENQTLQKYFRQIFFIYMVFLLLFLTSPPLYFITITLFVTAFGIFSKRYYAYEPEFD